MSNTQCQPAGTASSIGHTALSCKATPLALPVLADAGGQASWETSVLSDRVHGTPDKQLIPAIGTNTCNINPTWCQSRQVSLRR
jgi:hypothetical protein